MNEPEYNYCQVVSFQNASHAISKLEWEVTNGSELAKGAKKIKGVGKGIAALIDEYLETGEMTRNTKTSSVKHTETSVENSIDESDECDDESDESYDTDDVSSYNTQDDESDEEELEQDVEPFEHDGNYYFIDAEDMVYDPYDTITPEWWYDREHDKLITII
tara:strand:- start:678 stop:1163 length:486 start_codon:yes stop_codon:yes gene_type:complete